MNVNDIRPEVYELARQAEEEIRPQFERVDRIAMLNTRKVMTAFQDNKVSDSCFAGTTGYGYDDLGREVLDKVYAQVFCTEAALVRIGFDKRHARPLSSSFWNTQAGRYTAFRHGASV